MGMVDFIDIGKRYGNTTALELINLSVERGEFLTLLGPSGSGKTTLLNLIAGLIKPTTGKLLIDGKDTANLSPGERGLGMVFQNYALMPHMTVFENIAFPLRVRRVAEKDIKRRVREVLDLVRLSNVEQRKPKELSGGQQQRVSLARCIVYCPSLILMDEPLGALDKKLRDQMQLEIKRIHRELGTTIVYVTHDQEEAMTMSDRICLMNGGAIEQLGTPADLYFRPRTLFVADFLGESNLLRGVVSSVDGETLTVGLERQGVTGQALSNGAPVRAGQKVTLMLRPQNLRVEAAREAGPSLTGKLLDVMVTGSLTKLYLDTGVADAEPIVVAYPTRRQAEHYAIGQSLSVSWQAADAVAIPE